jgi:beta-galactosidase
MIRRTITLATTALLLAASAIGQVRQRIDSGWQFVRQDMSNAWEVFRPVQPGKPESVPLWQSVSLPHCYNADDGVEPRANYYQGAAWYRTYLTISNPYPDGHTLLEFEGAGQKTEVYADTIKVGAHIGGYDRWTVDITRFGNGRLPIAVRCDNSRDVEMIPSDLSDFCLYGGIYRHVSLLYMPNRYIEDVRIDVSGNTVTIAPEHRLNVEIIDPNGKRVYSGDNRKPITIANPALWDVDTPRLYTARITYGEQLIVKRFGLRTFEFREHGPFYLNGRRLLLKGTHRHEDHAGVGAAMTDSQTRREMQQIKDMGANFIRLGHYQQSDLVLELCDSLGLLVWEEIPWCRGGAGGDRYQQQAHRMLTNMINQHRHHPSVILWGLGNENDWPGDFSTKVDTLAIRRLMTSLNGLAHRLDPLRMTTIRRCEFCADIVDVYSPSIWAGWYSRRYTDYREMEQSAIRRYPRFFHAEWGGDSHAGRHAEGGFDIEAGDRNGDWSESYIVRLFDWHLKEQSLMDSLTGSAFWTFKDFCTPLRPDNPIPYVNQKGVCQRDGTPKESYYVVQSYWSGKPMLHIYCHSWPIRWGSEGEEKEILVYSNEPEVELFVNGRSYGKKLRSITDYPAQGFHWRVRLVEGANIVRAVSATLVDEITCEYQTARWGTPAQIRLSCDNNFVTVQICDEKGIPCLDSDHWIEFSLIGEGRLHQNLGTATGSSRIQAANGRASIRLDAWGEYAVAAKCYVSGKTLMSIKKKSEQ